jgi:hypothetical protein
MSIGARTNRRMDNPEKLATMDTRLKQTKLKEMSNTDHTKNWE